MFLALRNSVSLGIQTSDTPPKLWDTQAEIQRLCNESYIVRRTPRSYQSVTDLAVM